MNQTHIHLLITYLPIIGSILGALVLLHGIGIKSNQTIIAAYYIFVLDSIIAVIAYLTGEGAQETVENIQGVVETTIKIHRNFAIFALISLIILGLASVLGLFLTWRNSPFTRATAFIILFLSLISFGLAERTGYLGSQIRHTEISNGDSSNTEFRKRKR
ncbi:hypothetical protein AD998_20480 [bacterium 336/3]|nr:hypothetical protein AD998_20480 [bacterium 336/3]